MAKPFPALLIGLASLRSSSRPQVYLHPTSGSRRTPIERPWCAVQQSMDFLLAHPYTPDRGVFHFQRDCCRGKHCSRPVMEPGKLGAELARITEQRRVP